MIFFSFGCQLLQPDVEERSGRVRDIASEGAGPLPGSAVPEGSHEGPNEEADCDGPSRGPETPQTKEGQVCHHLAKL